MDMNKQPGILIKGIILASENFSREPILPTEILTNVNFDFKLNISDIDSNLEVTTTLKGTKDDIEYFSLNFMMVGIFSTIEGQENLEMESFLKHNAPAIIFPYIREHVSTITQKAGMPSVILAPINLGALLNQSELNKNKTELIEENN